MFVGEIQQPPKLTFSPTKARKMMVKMTMFVYFAFEVAKYLWGTCFYFGG